MVMKTEKYRVISWKSEENIRLAASTDLDGGSSEAAQLFDVLAFFPDDGSDSLCRNVYVDSLLLWGLSVQHAHTHTDRDYFIKEHMMNEAYFSVFEVKSDVNSVYSGNRYIHFTLLISKYYGVEQYFDGDCHMAAIVNF